ncbi:hypothetical protein PO909_030153 [Leuciscus waleckii]
MLGREMELPLDRLKAQGMAVPTAGSSQAQTKAAVNRHQQRMRQYFDRKHRVKQDGFILEPALSGEEMVAPLPSAPPPLVPTCTGPQQASHTPQAAPSPAPQQPAPDLQSHLLSPDLQSDPGLGRATSPAMGNSPAVLEWPQPEVEEGRPVRARVRPAYLKDFVTE